MGRVRGQSWQSTECPGSTPSPRPKQRRPPPRQRPWPLQSSLSRDRSVRCHRGRRSLPVRRRRPPTVTIELDSAENPRQLNRRAHQYHGPGCPVCSGWRYNEHNTLTLKRPDLAIEWHPTANGDLTPDGVAPGSPRYAWWQCRTCGHAWRARINARSTGSGCPVCAADKALRAPSE